MHGRLISHQQKLMETSISSEDDDGDSSCSLAKAALPSESEMWSSGGDAAAVILLTGLRPSISQKLFSARVMDHTRTFDRQVRRL